MNNLETLLTDMTFSTTYEFLNVGSNKSELEEIAKKRGIVLPSNDLAIFKGKYAFIDRQNKNGCTLPKEEVISSLETIVGKAIDFDHIRKRVVGYWADAKLEGDTIVAYGVFFKGNFQDDYEMIKSMMEKGEVGISFEAWGTREMTSAYSYNLKEVEFAGGALLIKTMPAFDGAGVMELANREKILELASILKAPEKYLKVGSEQDIENSRFFLGDFESIVRMVNECSCPICESQMLDIEEIDFADNEVKAKCVNCMCEMDIKMTPQPTVASIGRKVNTITISRIEASKVNDLHSLIETLELLNSSEDFITETISHIDEGLEISKPLTTKDRNSLSDDKFALIQTVKNKKGEAKKIRRFPINDENHVRNALARLPQAKNLTSEERDSVKKQILKRARELNMKDLLERYDKASVEEQKKMIEELALANAELAKAHEELKVKSEKVEAEIVSAKVEIETAKKAFDELKAKADADAVEIAKIKEVELAKKVTERKEKLGEFAKDMKDEDILDEAKYEFATLKMEKAKLEIENAELKKNGVKKEEVVMDKGSKDKAKDTETFELAKKVQEKAYPVKK